MLEIKVGNTPLVELVKIEQKYALNAKIYAKLESFNPAGSIKDRAALYMINDLIEQGKLKSGSTIIEPTSGNTGIGVAYVAKKLGYKVILTMPESMSQERRDMLSSYGAQLVLTPSELAMKGSIDKAIELNKEIKGSVILGQFENPSNTKAHYLTTGPEIYNQIKGDVSIVVAGIGTGGTISGVGQYLKEKNKDIKIVGVEPLSSPFLTSGVSGNHGIQGIGAGFKPKNLDTSVLDEVLPISDEEAYMLTTELFKEENIYAGISSGAAVAAAIKLAKKEENKDKNIVVILPDSGNRYESLGLYK